MNERSIEKTSYFLSNDANNAATPWITNFWPTQARMPEPKGRNAALLFGSFKTKEFSPRSVASSAAPQKKKIIEIFVTSIPNLISDYMLNLCML